MRKNAFIPKPSFTVCMALTQQHVAIPDVVLVHSDVCLFNHSSSAKLDTAKSSWNH